MSAGKEVVEAIMGDRWRAIEDIRKVGLAVEETGDDAVDIDAAGAVAVIG